MKKEKIRIGCGAGFSGDRIEPALVLAEQGELDYLVLECLAERTIALAQKRKLQDATKGYDPLLEKRIKSLLPLLVKNQIKLITNMGAANPLAAAQKVIEIAQELQLPIKVAAVTGDDAKQWVKNSSTHFTILENGQALNDYEVISINAYMGVEGILEALEYDAQVIITGRVSDPSLFVAPMVHEFGWQIDDFDLLGKGTVIGHLLECAGHITGGYFAEPIMKPIEGLENLGHPFADIYADGSAIISKVKGTGGKITLQTAKEQLLYEVINPHEYYTPDVIADFTTVKLEEIGENQIWVTGGTGKTKPSTYKASVGYKAFYLGEGEISYAGFNAVGRAKLAGEVLSQRLKPQFEAFRIDYIGLNSIFREEFSAKMKVEESYLPEVRLRVSGKATTAREASLIGEEVEALYTNGPAAGGGVRKNVNEVIGIVSILVDRNLLKANVDILSA
ncbi:acyclic terpene utilization AtuA family protein [Cellulophaga sp. BC115SP]|uniref:acyclic terpene utilization AtuA family protein n=1 Tax=Cellulophaga sp. BC115SP TaxID=2683263 RepID=UPI0014120CF3|nr:acyclic terpene utilization AtuA family protein [Cellulophaga sp. BC115SP]NBB29773.1 acyclic terpene utilization AtuA family protein [Cellulophaga sp. BC115SP]